MSQGSPRSLSGNAAVLIGAAAIASGVQFLIGIILANTLSKDQFGTYKQVYLLFGILAPLFTMALPGSLLYLMPGIALSERKRLISQTLLVLALAGAVLGGALALTANVWSGYFDNPRLAAMLGVFAWAPAMLLPATALSSMAVSMGRAHVGALYNIVTSLFGLVLVGGTALRTHELRSVMIAAVTVAAIHVVLTFVVQRKVAGGFQLGLDYALLKRQLAYSVPLAVSGLVGLLAYQVDRLLVSAYFPPAVFAVYAVGAVEIPLVSSINSSVNSVLIPRMSELHREGRIAEVAALSREAARKTALLVFPMFGFLMAFSAPFIGFLYPDYAESVPLFRIYLILLPLRIASYSLILQAKGETKYVLRGTVLFLVGNLGLSWILLRTMGLSGPAWGTVVATFCLGIWYYERTMHRFDLRISALLPWPTLARLLVIASASGALVVFILSWLGLGGIALLALGSALTFSLYVLLAVSTGDMTRADLLRLRGWVHSGARMLGL